MSIATDAFDRLHTTAESHHRVMLLELMGRNAGFIALHVIAGGADVILIPEIPFSYPAIYQKVSERVNKGANFSIISVAEGAKSVDQEQVFAIKGDEVNAARLGGIGQMVARYLSEVYQVESRVTVSGHLQRGGSPTPYDRLVGYPSALLRRGWRLMGRYGRMVALQCEQIVDISLLECAGRKFPNE